MTSLSTLTNENFSLIAFKYYNNPQCTDISEFEDDLNRFKYLKKLINRFIDSKEENLGNITRLALNHMITLFNVFGLQPTKKMLEFKMEKEQWPVIKTMLVYLGYIKNDEYLEYSLDEKMKDTLGKLR